MNCSHVAARHNSYTRISLYITGQFYKLVICMALFTILYSTTKEISRWDQCDLDTVLLKGDALYKTLGRRTLLTAEDLPRNFELNEGTVYSQFRENKYGIFDRGQLGNDNLLTGEGLFLCSRYVFCSYILQFKLLHI